MASLILLVSLSLAFLCTSQADLIDDVCKKALNPSFCTQVLRSDSRSRGADLRGLGLIIVEKSKVDVNDALSVAKSVKNNGNKEIIDTCVETFSESIDNLNECSELLKKFNRGLISDLQTKGSTALTDAGTCDDEFGSREPPKLKTVSRKAQDLIDILLAIANSF
ncbi:hypothetical protein CDL12_15787 [Handroanthus impetiginosus]|uniref:Pectinesterase inhibitor domain-containing protein n=1 Tax=Handroanthus impetiginosus TaxID=429701 RepID=A0A2G9H244_9LAMI|nr:hypothetical protein CDL12_15787 [Handroanthus impetiginosus]